MKVVCAWCGKEIGKYNEDSADVSHGICDKCVARFFPAETIMERGKTEQ